MGDQTSPLKVKSVASFASFEKLESKLIQMGFKNTSEATVVSDAKFWSRKLYVNQGETIAISNEIGDAMHLKDPIITLCACQKTIDEIRRYI